MSFQEFIEQELSGQSSLDQFGVPWLVVHVDGIRRPLRLDSPDTGSYLAYQYQRSKEVFPKPIAVKQSIEIFRWRASAGLGVTRAVRVSGGEGRIEIDLGTDSHQAICITPDAISISQPQAMFVRSRGILGLPNPGEGFTPEDASALSAELQHYLNLDDDQVKLFLAFIIAAFLPRGPYPVWYMRGPEGSGKTLLAKALRMFIDPNSASHTPLEGGTEKIFLDATWSHLQVYDNISTVTFSKRYSDLIAQISTGTARRSAVSRYGDQERLLSVVKPVVLNGIDDFVVQPDLLSRAVKIELNPVPNQAMRDEVASLEALQDLAPRVMTLVTTCLQAVLRQSGGSSVTTASRMSHWIAAIESCEALLGWPAGSFQALYEQNIASARADRVADSTIVGVIKRMLVRSGGEWRGSASELLQLVEQAEAAAVTRSSDWPRSPRALSAALIREEASLRDSGVIVNRYRQADGRYLLLSMEGHTITAGSADANDANDGAFSNEGGAHV